MVVQLYRIHPSTSVLSVVPSVSGVLTVSAVVYTIYLPSGIQSLKYCVSSNRIGERKAIFRVVHSQGAVKEQSKLSVSQFSSPYTDGQVWPVRGHHEPTLIPV